MDPSSDCNGREIIIDTTCDATEESMQSTLTEVESSIYRVPMIYRKVKPDAYNPVLVTFGPYHHCASIHLREMEVHKKRVLQDLIHYKARDNITYKVLLGRVRSELVQLMRCYDKFTFEKEEDYVTNIVEKYNADRSICVIAGKLQLSRKVFSEKKIVLLVMDSVKEFGSCMVKNVDQDEFTNLMVNGETISQLMVRHDVENSVTRVVVGELLRSSTDGNHKLLARRMLTESLHQFVHSLVTNALDELAGLMVRDGIFMILLFGKAASLQKEANAEKDDTSPSVPNASKIKEDILRPLCNMVKGLRLKCSACDDTNTTSPNSYKANDESPTALINMVQDLKFRDSDPVFGGKARDNLWLHIKRDMLLIENQLPLRVLEILLAVLFPEEYKDNLKRTEWLHKLVLGFFNRHVSNPCQGGQHILDLYRNCRILPQSDKKTRNGTTINNAKECPAASATLLFLKGVNIQQGESDCFNDFIYKERYWPCWIIGKYATLSIPKIELNDTSESILQNLVTFEALHKDTADEVTYFVIYMARLLRKPLHVRIIDYKVSLSYVWTKQDTAEFFQRLARGIPGALTKKSKERSLKWLSNILLWPSLICRFFKLLVIVDNGRVIAYIALAVALITWCIGYVRRVY